MNTLLRALLAPTILLGLLCPESSAGEAEPAAPADPAQMARHVFILSGQSNMTRTLREGFTEVVEKQFGKDQVTIALQMKSGRGIRFWVEEFDALAGRELPAKKSSSNGSLYPLLLQAAREATSSNTSDTVSFIWMQGESDAGNGWGDVYEKSFASLHHRLRTDLGLDTLHFVIGRISDSGLGGPKDAGWKKVRAAQVKFAEERPEGSWIDTDDLNGGEPGVPGGHLHYPKEGAKLLGERFAHQVIALLNTRTQEAEKAELPTETR